jgi:hypothetical protein
VVRRLCFGGIDCVQMKMGWLKERDKAEKKRCQEIEEPRRRSWWSQGGGSSASNARDGETDSRLEGERWRKRRVDEW